jgi:DNA-binding Lrp family transcriptional regulator
MPLQVDDYDISILKSLLEDGRRSFREISRETGITTPTVKARFTRLVNVGFIKSVSPILDFSIVQRSTGKRTTGKPELNKNAEVSRAMEQQHKHNNQALELQTANSISKKE